ncbi:PQQ-binding-like beta-propeller repeat protein [Kitasatospora aureofaciens]|uniref:outer membrane protein assembly factor BamB family protein n=1 Tax=Kitasatospora aureofaciens TaxID=1894 RepID=UPI001C43B9AD|nr:PQQ-binding-like beta-propeller repeat protein [Kitasatospora aureofaciens]MBV6702339.1 PQQ-binding-like beta-propeller repeat protein [Kitasatospora aureofaciens]
MTRLSSPTHRQRRRERRARALLRLKPGAALAAGLLLFGFATPAQAVDPTVSNNNKRTGWDASEPNLSPAQVSSSAFGQRWSTPVNGAVLAQPLVTGSNVIAATENNYVHGIDPATGKTNWTRQLGRAWPTSTVHCNDPAAYTGITATPVYDPASNTVYTLAKVNDGPDAQHPHWYLHALSASTGAERTGWPVTIQGTPTNSPGHPFNPMTANGRPGLLLMNGSVYAAFASYCDTEPYVGQVAGVNIGTRKVTLWSTEAGSDTMEGGIWQSGGGLVSDGAGRIFVATGNGAGTGASPSRGPGNRPPAHLGESVIRLGVNTDGSLSARDFFSPANNRTLDTNDTDLGSGGPMALPSGFGTAAHPHLLVQVGKDGRVFLLDRDNLGGMGQGPNGTDNPVSMAGPFEGVWGHPAVFGGGGGYVYTVATDTGNGRSPLRALKYGVNGSGVPVLTSVATSNEGFGYGSGSPVVTSNGTGPSSALVWAVWSGSGAGGVGGELRVYDAVPVNGVMHLRRSFPIGTAAKFVVPATDGGRVFVGTRDGHVVGFGSS